MAERRICRLVNSEHSNVDLKDYEKEILAAIERIVPNRHPKVEKDNFSTDLLSQSEAVKLGRELYSIEGLKQYAKLVTQARLFEGRRVGMDDRKKPTKGGHK